MADIISFCAAARRLRNGKAQSHDVQEDMIAPGPAQLLFFTGVRYERQIAAVAKKTRKRKVHVALSQDTAFVS